MLFSAPATTTAPANTAAAAINSLEKKERKCNISLLSNFNLVGDLTPNKTINIICPKIKNNCCTIDD
jgi:hypothetical protein